MVNQRHIKGAKIPDDMDVAAIRLNTRCPGHWMPYMQENLADFWACLPGRFGNGSKGAGNPRARLGFCFR